MEESIKTENDLSGDDLLRGSLTGSIREYFGAGTHDAKSQSALSLAYIGDCIYDLVVRTVLITHEGGKHGSLHNKATKLVNAEAQADLIDAIEPELTDEERAVYHRGRNANNTSRAKNASIVAYRKATGLEALIGYLYLEGRHTRLVELMKMGLGDQITSQDIKG